MEDLDIPTLMEISNFTGLWVSDYGKFLKLKQAHCIENNEEFVSNHLEFFGVVVYGIFKIKGFQLKDRNDANKEVIPWKCGPANKSIIKFEVVHMKYPADWSFRVQLTSLFASNFIMTVNAHLVHTITKLPNIQNWKVIFKTSKAIQTAELIPELFKSPLTETFAQLIGNDIYHVFFKKFWNLWILHIQNIDELTMDENKIMNTFNQHKKYLDSFEMFRNNTNSNRKLPYSLLTLRHIYLAFLCHLILQHLQWQTSDIHENKSKVSAQDDINNNDSDTEDIEMIEDEEKAVTIDDEALYGKTPQYEDEQMEDKNTDEAVNNDVIATIITRCMRYHRPFDMRYKVILPNGKDMKYTKIRYISMEHCALIVVEDDELIKCNLAAPKVKLILNVYVNNRGEISNLSGRKSLIKLLCENIVRRARDPLATSSNALGLMNSKIFSSDIWCILFAFLHFKDLLHFGYCSQLAYNISNDSEIWKIMYQKEYEMDKVKEMTIVNWKHKFHMQYNINMQQKSGTDQATLDLIKALMQQ